MNQLSGTTLAYIGDAVYEVMIREMLIKNGFQKVDNLHKEAIKYTSAVNQAIAFHVIESMLSEEELAIYKRGRNASTDRKAKNASIIEYKKATGFEALIGYLYLEQKTDRLEELLQSIIKES
jgi:ribonuclease-3 family protein